MNAEDSVAERFTRLMRASVSPFGVLTDPPLVCLTIALIVVPAILLRSSTLAAFGAVPLVIAIVADLSLRGARARVVAWLSSLPFAVDNVNALLNGVGQTLAITFEDARPSCSELDDVLGQIHAECFAMPFEDHDPEVTVQVGIADSKYNPAGAHYRRWIRVKAIIEEALVPMADTYPVRAVRIS